MSAKGMTCFPNGCCGFCAPPSVTKTVLKTDPLDQTTSKQETPDGYIVIHPGRFDLKYSFDNKPKGI